MLFHPHGRTIVLVHGSWHDGSAWEDVAKYLSHRWYGKYDVHTPTVAGHGPGADRSVSHAQAVDSIVDYIEEHDLEDIILLGHSFGGTILTQVAPRIPERIHRLVFHNAFVLNNGSSINEEVPPEYVALFEQIKDPEDGSIMLPENLWRNNFIQDADSDLAERTYALLTPEPGRMFSDTLDQTAFYEIVANQTMPMSYLNGTSDIALPHGEYAWYPRFARRLGFPRVIMADGSHELMFSDPRHLAIKIHEAARD